MKKIILALVLFSTAGFAQVSDRSAFGVLTSTCSTATATCDTAGVTVFGQYSDVVGPQTIEMNTQNYGLAQITAHGTYSGSTLNFEFSDDGGTSWYPTVCTRSDANIQEGSEAVAANANEGWECSVGAAKKFRVRQSAISSGGPIVTITLTAGIVEPAPTIAVSNTPGSSDPCQNPGVLKSSKAISITTAATTSLVTLAAAKITYVCGYVFTIQGSATSIGSLKFIYGTHASTACDTGATDLTGTFEGNINANVPTLITSGATGTQFATISANELCAVSAGTTISIKGVVSYVQQ